jgi:deoxyhypusine synthase
MIYFHSFRNPGLTIDIVRDIRALNDLSLKAKKAGMIILGGGVCKHQIANAMLIVSPLLLNAFSTYMISQRNGADFSVYIVSHANQARLGLTLMPAEHWPRV